MNAALLSQYLTNQPDRIQTILEALGYTHITYSNSHGQFRFSRADGQNPTSMVLNCDSLRFYCFSTGGKGNLYTLIMSRQNCSFPDSLRFVASTLQLDSAAFTVKVTYPFGGFYKKLHPSTGYDFDVPAIPEQALAPYLGSVNQLFLWDGIDYKTQELFQIGYDEISNRITIPERNFNGELCGIMGRSNDPDCPHESRWLPIIQCPRSKTLFGLSQNYRHIVETRTVVLFESEKAPMQCHSFGCHIALGLCGCHVSKAQRTMIHSLRPKRIILALDEGLTQDAVREQAQKLISNNMILQTKVGYVWDAQGEILKLGSKQNAADLGRAAYYQLLSTKVRWL